MAHQTSPVSSSISKWPDVVVTGLGIKFPESDNLDEFEENLFNKVDMVTADSRRWPVGLWNLPARSGKVKDLSRFDAQFFGMSDQEADQMDPQVRITLELTFEAIIDAGLNPEDLKGSKTGVFFGSFFNEIDGAVTPANEDSLHFKQMFSRHINYYFDFKGPSICYDTACSSTFSALNEALIYLRTGQLDYALVAGCNIAVWPGRVVQFVRIGMLSPDGKCNFLDAAGNGYVKSEACAVVLLQRKESARRIYAQVIHSKTNTDGFKEMGITFPKADAQFNLIVDTYREAGVKPLDVNYVEAHGTGTQAGDTQEIKAICDFFCPKDLKRNQPLLIGSVKTNMGHAEAVAGICSLVKVVIAYQTKKIPPMIHLKNPNPELGPLKEGLIEPVVEAVPFHGGYVGINSFGFGGANVHVILKNHEKEAKEEDFELLSSRNGNTIPRLIIAGARTESALNFFFQKVIGLKREKRLSRHLLQLIHEYSRIEPWMMKRRGALILTHDKEHVINFSKTEPTIKPKVVFVFPGLGCQYEGMAQELMNIDSFAGSIEKSGLIVNPTLQKYQASLQQLLLQRPSPVDMSSSSLAMVALIAFQIAIVDTLASLEIHSDQYVGHSIGELLCGYMDGLMSREQTLLAPLLFHQVVSETCDEKGSMAVVGLKWDEVSLKCSSFGSLFPACNNCSDTVTVAGSDGDVQSFMEQMKSENVFVKRVKSCSLAFHSPLMDKYTKALNEKYSEFLPTGNAKRSHKWISTSVKNGLDLSMKDYFINNLRSPVFFYESCRALSSNSILIEVSPQPFLTSVLKRNFSESQNMKIIPCLKSNSSQGPIFSFLSQLAEMYASGLKVSVDKLYPQVKYPVARGTPSLSPLIQWDHSKERLVRLYPHYFNSYTKLEKAITIDVNSEEWAFLSGHLIDGRVLFPATGYVQLAWTEFAKINGSTMEDWPVHIQNLKIKRATILSTESPTNFNVKFMQKKEEWIEFSIEEGGVQVSSGSIAPLNEPLPECKINQKSAYEWIQHNEIYQELRIRGYEYRKNFRMLSQLSSCGSVGSVTWSGEWIIFADNILHLCAFNQDDRNLNLPVSFDTLKLDMRSLSKDDIGDNLFIHFDRETKTCTTPGVLIAGPRFSPASRKNKHGQDSLESYIFIPNETEEMKTDGSMVLRPLLDIAIENTDHKSFRVIHASLEETFDGRIISELESLTDVDFTYTYLSPIRNIETPDSVHKVIIEDEYSLKQHGGDCHLLVVTNSMDCERIVGHMAPNLLEHSFILMVAPPENVDECVVAHNLQKVSSHKTKDVVCSLLRKSTVSSEENEQILVRVGDDPKFSWLNEIQTFISNHKKENKRLWLISENEPTSGILGLTTSLRQEPEIGPKVRSIFSLDSTVSQSEMETIFKKNLVMNIKQNNVWGSFRHVRLPPEDLNQSRVTEHAFINAKMIGDLTSLTWMEMNRSNFEDNNNNRHKVVCEVNNAPLNFRDIMLASGKLAATALPAAMKDKSCVIGCEFSGREIVTGKRVMGLVPSRGLATKTIVEDPELFWDVPNDWSMEEASTIPMVYATAYYALVVRGALVKGESVLIHSGSGGVGQAAISICLSYDCEVFTTVGSSSKKDYLIRRFPRLKKDNFFNSRENTFEEELMRATNGNGVDIVLNSLAEEKLEASIRCLAQSGRFLEIGKFDLSQDTPLHLTTAMGANQSFHGILLDSIFNYGHPTSDHPFVVQQHKKLIHRLIQEGLDTKVVIPLETTVFDMDHAEDAFRFMASGKHIGKVVLKVKEEHNLHPIQVKSLSMTWFDSAKIYIIIGGLGGFALEMVSWMIQKGCRKFILTSRSGIQNNYQKFFIQKLSDSYADVSISLSQLNVAKENEAVRLLTETELTAPVGGIFNLAMVLKDGLIENQSVDNFTQVCEPKVTATRNLDKVSRITCKHLDYFVVFSSVSAGKGIAGQTNYAYANSAMERIVEKRRTDSVTGRSLAIQWGAIGDVGVLARDKEPDQVNIRGTKPQRISSCLYWLDQMLQSNAHPVITSFTPASKSGTKKDQDKDSDLVSKIVHIIGIKDMAVMSPDSKQTLGELGIDSLMSVEIKQVMERAFDGKTFDVSQIRNMKILELHQLINSN